MVEVATNTLLHAISNVPFSRKGSYIAFSQLKSFRWKELTFPAGIWMRSVHGDGAYEVMLFELIENGSAVPCSVSCSASVLTLQSPAGGYVEICIPSESTVRIIAHGTTLRITARLFRNHGAIPEKNGNWIFQMASAFRSYRLVPLTGALSVDAPWEIKQCKHMVAELTSTDSQQAEMAIEELTWMRPPEDHGTNFRVLADAVQRDFDTFSAPYLNCQADMQPTARKAAYLNWSSVVQPHGNLKRPAMYMSKNWMTNVWSWDHAFNALATCISDPDLAWDQFMVIFDHQNEYGQIPDFINDVRMLTCFVKPPIHGWILARMIDISGPLPLHRTEEAYEKLLKWTDWWLQFRNPDGDGLPVYWHGNDSGWDNASVFDAGFPIKSADVAAFLILQMDMLASLAEQLERPDDAALWLQRADATCKTLLTKLWTGKRFQSIHSTTGKTSTASDSVFSCLPIILGQRLPQEIRVALAQEIRRHLTDWGPATEHPDSSCYQPDGYWRGPIWAPPTMILVDGLVRSDEKELAQDIAERFCALCTKSGFAENFNAVTGAPLCDPAYTWTSSVFLTLAMNYIHPSHEARQST